MNQTHLTYPCDVNCESAAATQRGQTVLLNMNHLIHVPQPLIGHEQKGPCNNDFKTNTVLFCLSRALLFNHVLIYCSEAAEYSQMFLFDIYVEWYLKWWYRAKYCKRQLKSVFFHAYYKPWNGWEKSKTVSGVALKVKVQIIWVKQLIIWLQPSQVCQRNLPWAHSDRLWGHFFYHLFGCSKSQQQ